MFGFTKRNLLQNMFQNAFEYTEDTVESFFALLTGYDVFFGTDYLSEDIVCTRVNGNDIVKKVGVKGLEPKYVQNYETPFEHTFVYGFYIPLDFFPKFTYLRSFYIANSDGGQTVFALLTDKKYEYLVCYKKTSDPDIEIQNENIHHPKQLFSNNKLAMALCDGWIEYITENISKGNLIRKLSYDKSMKEYLLK